MEAHRCRLFGFLSDGEKILRQKQDLDLGFPLVFFRELPVGFPAPIDGTVAGST